MGFKRKLVNFTMRHYIGNVKNQEFWRKVYETGLRGMNIGEGGVIVESGEEHALEYILGKVVPADGGIIFDIGANVGEYTKDILKKAPKVKVHCFEPAQATFSILKDNLHNKNVILNNWGISNKKMDAMLYYGEDSTGLASLYARQIAYFDVDMSQSETVKLDTIDNYCEENSIPYIHFMKMDIEGNEYKALLGANSMLTSKSIGAVQFEFGGCNIESRTFFRDFWNLLHENYNIYRIVKNGLTLISYYTELNEIFSCTNYMCILKELEK